MKHYLKYRSVPAENQFVRLDGGLAFSGWIGYLVVLTIVASLLQLTLAIIAVYVLTSVCSSLAQGGAFDSKQALDSLRTELDRIEAKLADAAASEQGVLAELDMVEAKAALQQELVRQEQELTSLLRDSVDVNSQLIAAMQATLWDLGETHEDLSALHADAASSLAKALITERRLGEWATLEFLSASDSWEELVERRAVWLRFRERQQGGFVAVHRTLDSLQATEAMMQSQSLALTRQNAELSLQIEDAAALDRQLESDRRALKNNRLALKRQLKRVQSDRALLQARQNEIQAATSAIEEMVTKLAHGEAVSGVPLQLMKGSLPWPVEGDVVERYGLTRNAELQTVTDNPGIDLASNSSADVVCVADGQVSSVTRLRGFGNVCIVEHPAQYYTVYARLASVNVKPGDHVIAGSVVGAPGYDAATEKYRLHFELWAGREKKDPMAWLQPR